MRRLSIFLLALLCVAALPILASGTEAAAGTVSFSSRDFVPPAPDAPFIQAPAPEKSAPSVNPEVAAVWPFGGGDTNQTEVKPTTPKSPRKAFFLSMLLPGLGEYYAGSKRGIFFLGVEAVGWWMYSHFTSKGNDQDTTLRRFADANWLYDATSGRYSYSEWLANRMSKNSSAYTLPLSYAELSKNPALMDSIVKELTDKNDTWVTHSLPPTKTQQYYEMIGKYPQFVYGWKDIVEYTESVDTNGNTVKHYLNPTLVDPNTGAIKGNYDENIRNINSNMRNQYVDMRKKSNDNLKLGQDGVSLLIVNRVVSAIDAARIAYHRNKSMESELSMVRVNLVQKHILDHEVPMLMVSKKF